MKKCVLLLSCVVLLSMLVATGVEAQLVSTVCQTVPNSGQPTGLAYDTAHSAIWVAMWASGFVAEYNTSCALIRTVTTGVNPNGVVFDGTNIWVSNFGSNSVTKINSATGAVLATIPVGGSPRGLAFDGTYIWVANSASNTVSEILATSNAVGLTCSVGSTPFFPTYNPFDDNVYIPNRNSNTMTVMHRQNCNPVRTVATDSQPQFTATDGSGNVWVSCFSAQRVDQFSTAGVKLKSINPTHSGPMGVTYDALGGLIWGATWSGYVYEINPSTGAVGQVTFRGGSNHGHYGIVWPGLATHLWATDNTGSQVNYLLE